MYHFFSDNKNQLIVISLLKSYGIRKVIASPGGTNPALLLSMQLDGYFEMYSSVDERSAAYMACGLAEETGEPVVLCCTGATASRNYMSAMTEAYYRKLPIIVLTCSRPNRMIGHLMPQVTNRSQYLADTYVFGTQLQDVKDENDFKDCEIKVNQALHACKRRGGGPVHLNIECGTQACNTKTIPIAHKINYSDYNGIFPEIKLGKIAVYIGSHRKFTKEETGLIDQFCRIYNAVVICDHTSGYYGEYKFHYALLGTQIQHSFDIANLDLIIDIGEVSGDYFSKDNLQGKIIWRVSEDGEIRLRFNRLDHIFEMSDKTFFSHYSKNVTNDINTAFFDKCNTIYNKIYESIPELPLCHISIAKVLSTKLPKNCTLHFAIMNALRSWNFFKIDNSITTNCNVGGFGIDGCTSSAIGASLANPQRIYFIITGDLAFFYDLNSLGNRHIGNNLRILLVNDGEGAEFKHFKSVDHIIGIDDFVAGAGHFGQKSKELVKHFSEDLGFEYLSAVDMQDFCNKITKFAKPQIGERPMLLEVFTSTGNQSYSWENISNIATPTTIEFILGNAKKIVGKNIRNMLKGILK